MANWFICPSTAITTGVGTRENPFKCNAINWTSMLAGDTIYLRANSGEYKETLTIGKSGTADNFITIASDPLDGELAVINGELLRLVCITQSSKSYIWIKNIRMKNTSGTNNRGILPGSNFKIDGCFFEDMQYTIAANATTNIEINDLTMFNCSALSIATVAGAITLNGVSIDTDNGSRSQLIISNPTSGERTLSLKNVVINNAVTPENDQGALRLSGLYAAGSVVENIKINGSVYKGLYTTTASGITFNNINIQESGLTGCFISTGSHDLVLNDCVCEYNLDDGFGLFTDAYNIEYNNCIAKHNGYPEPPDPTNNGDGFTTHGTGNGIVYRNCVAMYNRNSGLALVDTTAGKVINCTIAYNGDEAGETNRAGLFIGTTGDNATAPAGEKSWVAVNNAVQNNYPRELWLSSEAAASTSYTPDNNIYKPLSDTVFATIDGGSTDIDWATYHATYEANSIVSDAKVLTDGKIPSNSPCVDAGVWVDDINNVGQVDPWGKKTYGLPNIGADQGAGMPVVSRIKTVIGKHIKG